MNFYLKKNHNLLINNLTWRSTGRSLFPVPLDHFSTLSHMTSLGVRPRQSTDLLKAPKLMHVSSSTISKDEWSRNLVSSLLYRLVTVPVQRSVANLLSNFIFTYCRYLTSLNNFLLFLPENIYVNLKTQNSSSFSTFCR